MLQYQLDHMELGRRNMEMRRTEMDARHSYNDFNIIMMVSGIMIANNIAVLTAVEHAPSIHSSLFDASGSMSCFCFFYVLARAPFLIALAVHLGENGPALIEETDSAIHRARRLFRHGAPLIFCAFGLGLLMAAVCFVVDVPALKDEHTHSRYGFEFWTRGALALYTLIRAWRDLKGDVHIFVLSMGQMCDPKIYSGYAWIWWFGPYPSHVAELIDVGPPMNAYTIRERLQNIFSPTGPDAIWLNVHPSVYR